MDDSLKHEEIAGEAGIDPEKVDFTLDEKELEDVSGGIAIGCVEIGNVGTFCTMSGL